MGRDLNLRIGIILYTCTILSSGYNFYMTLSDIDDLVDLENYRITRAGHGIILGFAGSMLPLAILYEHFSTPLCTRNQLLSLIGMLATLSAHAIFLRSLSTRRQYKCLYQCPRRSPSVRTIL
jgi:hypothetical protein